MDILIIWDIDGTLILGPGVGKIAMERAFYTLYGIEKGFDGINMAGMLDYGILHKAYESQNIKGRDTKLFFDLYCKYLEEEMSKVKTHQSAPGISELLDTLTDRKNFHNALGTGNVERAARIKLSFHDMNRYFPVGGFGDEELERWKAIEKAVARSKTYFGKNFANENIYVVGDTPKDIECAMKLKVRSVGVTTGPYSREELAGYNPDYLFNDLSDAQKFLDIFKG